MFGCNNFCSYCIVPYVRGRERSREPKDIIRAVSYTHLDVYKRQVCCYERCNSFSSWNVRRGSLLKSTSPVIA